MDVPTMYSLTGKRAIACGSTQGIGRACALQFARLGAEVTLIARDEGALRRVSEELDKTGGRKHAYICADFTDPQGLKEKVSEEPRERPFMCAAVWQTPSRTVKIRPLAVTL